MSLHQLFCTNEAIAREVDSPFLLGIECAGSQPCEGPAP